MGAMLHGRGVMKRFAPMGSYGGRARHGGSQQA